MTDQSQVQAPQEQPIDDNTRQRVYDELKSQVGWAGNTLPNGLTAYKVARGNDTSSGLAIVEKEGELYVLLERPKRNPEHWEVPAGYREYTPEASLGGEQAPEGQNTLEPTAENMHQVLKAKFESMTNDPNVTAKQIKDFFEDETAIENYLAEAGVKWDNKLDATLEGTFLREVEEETGIKIDSTKVHAIDSFGTVNIASGTQKRNNQTDHFFLADMGIVDELPPIKLQEEEVTEAKWVKLSDIQKKEDGNYQVEGDLLLDKGQAWRVELALQEFVNNKVAENIGMRFDSVKQEPTLVGPEGVQKIKDYIQKAEQLGAGMPSVNDQSANETMTPGEQPAPTFMQSLPLVGALFR